MNVLSLERRRIKFDMVSACAVRNGTVISPEILWLFNSNLPRTASAHNSILWQEFHGTLRDELNSVNQNIINAINFL